jgi:hypothetical protein
MGLAVQQHPRPWPNRKDRFDMKFIPYLVSLAFGFFAYLSDELSRKILFLVAAVLYGILIDGWLQARKQTPFRSAPVPETYQLGLQIHFLIEECRALRQRISAMEQGGQ